MHTDQHSGTPEDGHRFTITMTSRGSYAVGDGPHYDTELESDPRSVTVRAWSLHDALLAAAALPLAAWYPDDYLEEGSG